MTPTLPARTAPAALEQLNEVAQDVPRAIVICMRVAKMAEAIDPDADFGPQGWLFHLITLRIQGQSIVTLHDVVCEGDVVLMLGLLRAVQIGHLSEAGLATLIAAAHPIQTFEACALLEKVRRDLPRFYRGRAPK